MRERENQSAIKEKNGKKANINKVLLVFAASFTSFVHTIFTGKV